MHDIACPKPDHRCLFAVAADQHGYLTAADARGCGFSSDLLGHHVSSGRLQRVSRGIYRLRDFPPEPADEVAEAWIRSGKLGVVSHESAMELLDLGDVIPRTVHLTVPRSLRWRRPMPGVTLHTVVDPLPAHDLTEREGLPVTSPLRTILDTAAAGLAGEQIDRAVREAAARGWIDPGQLAARAQERGPAVAAAIARALAVMENGVQR